MSNAFYTKEIADNTGRSLSTVQGHVEDDKFRKLISSDGLAKVTTTYQQSLDFGKEKVVVTVSCACDQNEVTINKAGELTFLKALELVADNFSLLEESAKSK